MNRLLGWNLVFVSVCVFSQSVVGAGEQALSAIHLGSDGSVKFVKKFDESVVKYTPTGFLATKKAQEFPDAIKQVVEEGKSFVSVKTEVKKVNMIGLLTWRKVEVSTLVLAKEGNTIVVREPTSEAEKQESVQEFSNPFGLVALVSIFLLLASNILLAKGNAIASVIAIAFAAIASVIAIAFAAIASVIAIAFAVVASAIVAAAIVGDTRNKSSYHFFSGLSGALMLLAVSLAIWF